MLCALGKRRGVRGFVELVQILKEKSVFKENVEYLHVLWISKNFQKPNKMRKTFDKWEKNLQLLPLRRH